jgi:PKD repeat protein
MISGKVTSIHAVAFVALLALFASAARAAVPVIDSSTAALVSVGDPFDDLIDASDSPTSFGATGQPGSFAFNTSTGELMGSFATTGTYTIQLSATNVDGTGTATLTVTVLPQPPVITSAGTATGAIGAPFSYQITATNTPNNFGVSDLPDGLVFDNTTGLINGSPTIGGTFFLVIAADNDGGEDVRNFTLTISGPNIVIVSSLFDTAKVGVPYEYDITTAGEDAAAFVVSGLPSGLIADGAVISGSPDTAGSFQITLIAISDTGDQDMKTLSLDVLSKDQDIGPSVSQITVDPLPPMAGEEVLFSIDAEDPENNDVTISWDFGDGTTDSGSEVVHAYAAAGAYTVTATADNGSKTSVQTVMVKVIAANPNAPIISGFTLTPNPAGINQAVAFAAQSFDPNGDLLIYTWNFGDGTPVAHGIAPSHAFARSGSFTVTLSVKDGTGVPASRPFKMTAFVFDSTGLDNITEGDVVANPLNGLSQTVMSSDAGIFGLAIDVNAFNRAAFEISTDFDGMTRNAVKGITPVAKAPRPGIFIATTEARDIATRSFQGHARKTLPVSRKELGLPPLVTAEPADHRIKFKQIKGSFTLPPNSVIGGRAVTTAAATAKGKSKPDFVTASGTIELPAGLDFSQPQELQISVGNIVDKLVLDAKGKGKGQFSQIALKARVKKGAKTTTGTFATFTVKISTAQMVNRGFDTEGVGANPKTTALKIQSAMMIGGVVYAIDTPATLKVSPAGDSATIGGRSSF